MVEQVGENKLTPAEEKVIQTKYLTKLLESWKQGNLDAGAELSQIALAGNEVARNIIDEQDRKLGQKDKSSVQ